jgi:hypothetical protein
MPSGSKLWRWKYRLAGKETRYAVGACPDVPLAEARDRCEDARESIFHNGPPLDVALKERE